MANIKLDGTLLEIALETFNHQVADWLGDMKKSSNSLTAIFRDASFRYRGKVMWFTNFTAEQVGAEVNPDSAFAVKALKIAEAAEKNGMDMKEWQELLPKLKEIAAEAEQKNAGAWRTAAIARRVLQPQ